MKFIARRSPSLLLALALCFFASAPLAAVAVAPSPGLVNRMKHDPALAKRVTDAAKAAKAKGVDAPLVDRIVATVDAGGAPHVRVAKAPPTSGELRTLAILVDFSDRTGQVAAASFDSLLFADVEGPASLRGYYQEVSYGGLDVTTNNLPSSVGWQTLPHTAAYYAGTANGQGDYPQNSQGMVTDALALVNGSVDFSQYDNDDDGFVDNLIVVHAGTGAEETEEDTDIWSHAWQLPSPVLVDGVRVSAYSTEPEYWVEPGDMTVGVYAHEVGHVLGLPDLYDYDYSSEGVGDWSLMAGGSWNGASTAGGDSPSRLDAWCSDQLGWLQPATVTGAPSTKSLPTVGTSATGTAYRVYPAGATSGPEYFLVENRQKTGTDSYLPGDGILVWHVDETMLGNGDNDDENRKLVDLEEADGLADLDVAANRGDAGDPFPGTSDNQAFTVSTNPDSRTNLGADSLVSIDTIGASQTTMSARIGVGVPGSLSGAVSDSEGPLAGVSIFVPGYAPVTTGPTGAYSLAGVAPGEYDVSYAKTAYATQTLPLTVSEGADTVQNVTMVAGPNDDDIPGVDVPASPFSEVLDEVSDATDVFKVHLDEGQMLSLTLDGAIGSDFDVYLFAPGAASVFTEEAVAWSQQEVYPEEYSYVAPVSGDYYICSHAFSGSGAYTVTYSIVDTGHLAGTVSGPSGVLSGATISVFGEPLAQTGADGVYDIGGIPEGVNSVTYSRPGYVSQTLDVTIAAGGTTTQDVTLAAGDPDDEIPGVVAPSSPIVGTVDADSDEVDVYRIHLNAGDRLSVTLSGPDETDFDVYLYGPQATSVYTDDPLAGSEEVQYPDAFQHTATTAGDYYLLVNAYDGAGEYSITYTKTAAASYRPVHRFRNLRNGFYLWSADESEKANIIANLAAVWEYEGVAYRINVANTSNRSPLWRFRNISGGFYLYSADANEKASIVANLPTTWQYEGPAYSVSTNRSGRPVWRFRNLADGTYLYSADPKEKDSIVANLSATWQLEGPAYYLAP